MHHQPRRKANWLTVLKNANRVRLITGPRIIVILFAATIVSALGVGPNTLIRRGSAQETARLSAGVLQQIDALNSEKESRTPAQQKIDSQLIYATKMHRGEPIANGVATLEVNVGADAAGLVTVDITANVTNDLLDQLKGMGIVCSSVFPKYHALRAVASLDQLEAIASLPEV